MLSSLGTEVVDRARVILPRRRRGATSLRQPAAWAAVVVIAAGGLLSGCSPDPEPAPTAGASESAATLSPSATPTPTGPVKPERPAAMDDPGTAGAVATATYFMALYGYVGGGDLVEWKALSHPECVYCNGVVDEVERMMSVGHHQVGPTITITSTDSAEVKPGEFYGVDFKATQEPWQEFDSLDALVQERADRLEIVVHLNVIRSEGGWLIAEGETEIPE